MFSLDLTFVATAVNLALLYFFVNKFVFKRLAKNMDERSAAIAAGLARGQELTAETEKFNSEREEWRKDSSAQQKSLLDAAKTTADKEASRIINEAQKEAARIKEEAQAHIEREREAMRQSLTKEAVSLALAAASEVIAANVDDGKNRKLAEDFLSGIEEAS